MQEEVSEDFVFRNGIKAHLFTLFDRIHDSARACLDCGDMEHKYIEWKYRFFLRLEDREGNQIDVAVCDEAVSFVLHVLFVMIKLTAFEGGVSQWT